MERVAQKAKGMRVTFAFYSSWYLFAHGSHQQCPLCSQHSAPPSLQSLRPNKLLQSGSVEGRTLSCLSLASLGKIQLERRGLAQVSMEGVNGIMEEKRRECRWLTPALAGAEQDT